MNLEDVAKENHDLIMDFLNSTTNFKDNLSNYVKATLCQFLLNLKQNIHKECNGDKNYPFTREKLIELQIHVLNECIEDLRYCLNKNANLH